MLPIRACRRFVSYCGIAVKLPVSAVGQLLVTAKVEYVPEKLDDENVPVTDSVQPLRDEPASTNGCTDPVNMLALTWPSMTEASCVTPPNVGVHVPVVTPDTVVSVMRTVPSPSAES